MKVGDRKKSYTVRLEYSHLMAYERSERMRRKNKEKEQNKERKRKQRVAVLEKTSWKRKGKKK